MAKWTFDEKQQVTINFKTYMKKGANVVLGIWKQLIISNVNMGILCWNGSFHYLSSRDSECDIEIKTVFLAEGMQDANPFTTPSTWSRLPHGFADIYEGYPTVYITDSVGLVGTNPIYKLDDFLAAANTKKVRRGVETSGAFIDYFFQVTGFVNWGAGAYDGVDHHEYTFSTGSQLYKLQLYGEISQWFSTDTTLIDMEKAYPLGETSPSLTSYAPNVDGLNNPITTAMFTALVDAQVSRPITFFDAWQFNNQTELRWNNTDEKLASGMIIDLRIGDADNDVANSFNWKNTGYGYQPVNVTFDLLKDISGQSLRIYPIYLFMRARNVAQDYETDWAYISIDADGYVADSGYVSDRLYITLTVHDKGLLPPEQKSDDEKNDNNEVSGDDPPSGHTPTSEKEVGLNLMTTTYLLSDAQLKEIGNELWSKNFMDNILMLSNSPIENILSCKIFPTTFSGVASAVKIGNVTMLNGATAQKISVSGLSKETGAITFPQKYNSFLDFAPFTNAKIFIPFVGFQPLPVANFIGAQLSLRYVFDVVTGAVTVYLLRNNAVFDKYSGICAVDVPITASNRAQVEVGQIQSAITAGAQLATGNIGGALSAGLSIASIPNHFNTRGNAGGYTSQFDPRQPYLIIDRPKAQSEIVSYGKTSGFPCNLTKTLNKLSGFTSVHDVHLDDVPCLESERQELKAIMQKGFII